MSSTFFGLNIGTTGLYTYQAGLNTTAHNIANAETEGYTRQIVNQKAGNAIKVNSAYGMAGAGVDVTGVTQERNEYYDLKYWKNNTLSNEYSTKQDYMTEIENYFNEIELEGFTTSFNSLNNSLQELANDPSNLSVRTQVTNYSKSLTEYFNFLSTSMKSIQEESNFEVKNQVDQINSIGKQLATLTKQINILESGGGVANDLRDQRALLVDDLSGIANISVSEKVVGAGVGITSYTVKINGQTLVDTNNFNILEVVPRSEKVNQNDVEGLYDIVWGNGQNFEMGSERLGGTLQALFEVRDGNNGENLKGKVTGEIDDTTVTLENISIDEIEKLNIPSPGIITIGNHEYKYKSFTATYVATTQKYTDYVFQLDGKLIADANNETATIGDSVNYKGIPYYMSQMNEFVRTFAKSFNDIHKTGEDLNGDAGIDFFNGTDIVTGENVLDKPSGYYGLTAANFTVTDAIYTDPSLIAAATNIANGVEDNSVLDALIALKSDKDMFKQGTPASFLQTLVVEIGIDTGKSASFSKSQGDILKMIDNQRLSISGVDVDEETMNLIRFQNAYNLSAKVISIMNEIYDKLINGMGV